MYICDSLKTHANSYNSFTKGSGAIVPIKDTVSFSSAYVKQKHAQFLKELGDKFAHSNQDSQATYYYEGAIRTKPEYISPYYSLARVHEKTGRLDKAIETYKQLVNVKPDEVEAITLMGICYKEKGDYEKARLLYKLAMTTDPKYDFAARSLKEIEYLILARENPGKAELMKQQTARENLQKALTLVNKSAPRYLTKDLNRLNIIFDETDSLSGHRNIAQYENRNRRIVITNEYIWAAPEITAAYIIHEAVHAKDRDSLTSVMEEQDAYEISIKFWLKHNNGVKDPELDYAADLYKQNPELLREKVGKTYKTRDKSIPDYSPNHMPIGNMGPIATTKIYLTRLKNNFFKAIGIS